MHSAARYAAASMRRGGTSTLLLPACHVAEKNPAVASDGFDICSYMNLFTKLYGNDDIHGQARCI